MHLPRSPFQYIENTEFKARKPVHRYALGQQSMAPLLEAAREFDITTNPHPAALFEAGPGGVQIWCTPADNPGFPWNQVEMAAGAFAKPCAFVGSTRWQCSREKHPMVVNIVLTTIAYTLAAENLVEGDDIFNQPDDIAWAKQKLHWLWEVSDATGDMPPIVVKY